MNRRNLTTPSDVFLSGRILPLVLVLALSTNSYANSPQSPFLIKGQLIDPPDTILAAINPKRFFPLTPEKAALLTKYLDTSLGYRVKIEQRQHQIVLHLKPFTTI